MSDISQILAVVEEIRRSQLADQADIDARLTDIAARLPPRQRATRIALELPAVTRGGKPVPNYELPNDEVVTITIKTTNQAGITEPYPAGDTFTVVSNNPASLNAVSGTDANGNPAAVINALVQLSPNVSFSVSDTAGLNSASQMVDIVQDKTPRNIVLDLADATSTAQPVPTNPGP